MLQDFNVTDLLIKGLVLLTAMPVHECAHAWAASKLGDDTARNQGRITLNPASHLSILGSISMVIFGFGWAKPVQINPRNFKNPKAGMALSSLAGPVSNLLLAYIAMILYKIFACIIVAKHVNLVSLLEIFQMMAYLNIGLAVFNLLPIPPLDGSRIATLFLPPQTYFKIMQYEQYIFIGLILLLSTPILQVPLQFLMEFVYKFLNLLSAWVPYLMGLVM